MVLRKGFSPESGGGLHIDVETRPYIHVSHHVWFLKWRDVRPSLARLVARTEVSVIVIKVPRSENTPAVHCLSDV
jgi:hypothetical protein